MSNPRAIFTGLIALLLTAVPPVFAQTSHQHNSAVSQSQTSQSQKQAAQPSQATPWLGVTIQDVNQELARSMGMRDAKGVMISNVAPGSPADDAGLNTGDVIVKLNGKDVRNSDQFISEVQSSKVGNQVALEVNRAGQNMPVNVMLAQMPEAMRMQQERMMGGGMMGGMHPGMMGAAPQACPQCPADGCPQMGMGGGMMGGMGGGMMGRHKMGGKMGMMDGGNYGKMYMMAVRQLNLTPDQMAKARVLHSDYMKRTVRAKADIKVAKIELKELVTAEPVNLDKVKAKVSDITAKKADLMFSRIKALEDFKKILNDEQRGKLRDMMQMGPMMGGMGGGMMGQSCPSMGSSLEEPLMDESMMAESEEMDEESAE